MKLPESSQKIVDYNWPIVKWYAYIQIAKDLTDEQFIAVMTDYLANKSFLVRERKALLEMSKELLHE